MPTAMFLSAGEASNSSSAALLAAALLVTVGGKRVASRKSFQVSCSQLMLASWMAPIAELSLQTCLVA